MSALVVAGLVLAGGGCAKRDTLRYRVTISIETPTGVKTGSSVIESRNAMAGMFQSAAGDSVGEAVVVDLGGGRTLFALMQDPHYNRSIHQMVLNMLAYPELKPRRLTTPEYIGDWRHAYPEARKLGASATIRPEDYPMLVTFGDLKNHLTVKEVAPGNPSAALGAGYALRSISVALTDEPRTRGIVESRIPWIRTLGHSLVPSKDLFSHEPLANDLAIGAFIGERDI